MESLSIASNNGVVSEEEGRDDQERAPRSGLSNSGEGEAETGDSRKLCAAEGSTNDREREVNVSTESAPARVKDEVPELKSGVPELESEVPELESVTIKEEVCNGEEEETEVESLEVACMKDERFAEDHSDSNEGDRSSTASRADLCKDRVDSIEAANLNTQRGTSTENAKCGGQDALKKTLPPRLQTEEKDGARVKNRRECKEREQSTRVQRHLRVKIRVPGGGGGGGGGERAYECAECQQSFETRRTFNLHKKSTHQAEFICSECGETFGKIIALQKHQRIHAAEKPYPCPECGKNFRHSRALKRHVEIHRRVRRYPLQRLLQELQPTGQPGDPQAGPLGDEAAPLPRVRQGLQRSGEPEAAPADPHGGQAAPLLRVREELQPDRQPGDPPADPHGREALSVLRVREVLQPLAAPQDAPAPAQRGRSLTPARTAGSASSTRGP
ncbi:zinc finger protein 892-like [Acipenser ruthenus]|uniref:zinc finger protein 892-like n=1 Tax=Acipenser ruthenus TaxID=7906 RepID=UPI002741B500|nr:zinc finger protein 892-like [Acipenser ruthenus]XP_058865399.1 zinc finger protein 892-like [Acipenser ruthenus]